ncbi:outer membrane beta-barrel protein [Helicobacter mustelae]|uniref:Uncharacterized protein n=1 Tax=Helicobacter mustelae (strain ATCC 43772 / CCUG 25715 / CIP 103759 / LMG 18044 / NCTC 12198 / R85-136P) TaxID=679897 RepID=D3UIN8_HELM1|nr:outer membrane beta-barrel protein [Helicobacter mustelae]CBG40363.1 Putative hypothetical protein [Helicobacter mustelae 12198]SQH71862.1 Uncharacterised protein [Helicobacter mustelae]STP13001.1 Uncharacterised protein [Helicobacter mustelae]
MLRRFFVGVCCLFALCPADQSVYTPIGFSYGQDYNKAREKSGFILGGGIGLPSATTQSLTFHRFRDVSSYGFHLLFGYQDFTSKFTPFPFNYFGARVLLEFYNTYHLTKQKAFNSNVLSIGYDLLYDIFPNKAQTFGLLLGVNIGMVRIQDFQSFSLSFGLKFGFSYAFSTKHRLEASYLIAESGPLQGDRFYFYSPYTINVTYTYLFAMPFKK